MIVAVVLSCGHTVSISVRGEHPKRPILWCDSCKQHREVIP